MTLLQSEILRAFKADKLKNLHLYAAMLEVLLEEAKS